MLIRHWMTSDVISATPDMSVLKASGLMEKHNIRRLPVINEQQQVVGIVSDRDIKDAAPSKATSLDIHEIRYLLSELKVKDIMTANPVCIAPHDTIESVAMLMEERGFGGLPVTENNKLIGIISDNDVFKVLISITGARQGGTQLAFNLPDKPGYLRKIFEVLQTNGASIISILTHRDDSENTRRVFIRIRAMEPREREQILIEILQRQHALVYWARNSVHLS